MKIQLFKKDKKFKQHFRKKDFAFNANFYWRIAVLATCVLVILSFLFAYHLFMEINGSDASQSVDGSTVTPLMRRDRLENTLKVFSDRERRSAEILNSPSPVVDPSR